MSRLFNGEFRRKPDQSLGGATRKLPREVLIQKAAEERQARQEERKRNEAGTVIQSHFKKWFTRKRLREQMRVQFDAVSMQESKTPSEEGFHHLFQWLLVFYTEGVDDIRLSQFSQTVLKQKDLVTSNVVKDRHQWLFRVQKLLDLNCDKIAAFSKSCEPMTMSGANTLAIPLRLIEVFTAVASYDNLLKNETESKRMVSKIWTYLIRNGYFQKLRSLIDSKVPEPFSESIKPPTPLAASLCDLVLQPLKQDYGNHETVHLVVNHAFSQLLSGPFSPQTKFLLIPVIVNTNVNNLHPVNVINCLINPIPGHRELNPAESRKISPKHAKMAEYHPPRATNTLTITPDIWLTYTVLKLTSQRVNKLIKSEDKSNYLKLLKICLTESIGKMENDPKEEESDDGTEYEMMDQSDHVPSYRDVKAITLEILDMVNDNLHVTAVINSLDSDVEKWSDDILIHLSCIGYVMLSHDSLVAVNKYRFLYTLAFKPLFLRHLWNYVTSVSTPSVFGSPTSLLQVLSRGLPIAAVEWDHILPQLTLFCSLLGYLLPTVDDVQFYGADSGTDFESKMDTDTKLSTKSIEEQEKDKFSKMPFTIPELESMTLILRDACLGLIELAYQDTKITVKSEEYKRALRSVQADDNVVCEIPNVKVWLHLFKSSVQLLRNLHMRDSRRPFCSNPNHWISRSVSIPVEKPTNFRVGIRQRERYQQFVGIRRMNRKELEDGGPPMSTSEVRNITILQEIPFVVPFKDRVKIFQALLNKDRVESRGHGHHFLVQGSTIDVTIRRNYIYEDAFEKLSPENEPNLKKPIRVQLVNTVGLDEAGIDGGGIFREFLNELLKTCFDPNRGLFSSSHDRLLFPNPASVKIFGRNSDEDGEVNNNNFMKHYYFVGRMLGKALYENMLVELPFATFFLAKILSTTTFSDVDIHHLATLDPTMYKNLVYLKNYTGNIADLGLDFTIVNSDLGENEEVELKPGGKNIPVTASNRYEYIHLMADYRLNKQIRFHCQAFKKGMSNVIDLDWIRMFSPNELQELISGAPHPIDVADLKANTKYGGGYDANHPVIKCFWKVVDEFSDNQRKQLLKFVTSCSRPPLLGFKDLQPPFCVQCAGKEDRLPTSSTCMNLLKLPEFIEKETLKSKLLYAIESGVGFELS